MTTPERRLAELGLELPPAPKPIGTYVPAVQVGNLLYLSGLGPRRSDGTMVQGKVGTDLTIEQGREAARLVGLNMLANIRAALGSLDRVERIVKTLGMVNLAPDFDQHPKVIDGYADLFVEVFGPERGRGARSAVGMAALPNRIAVEVETIVQVRD
jgi:enamine deaminase RidA (YjgF/YER057c/UK114 family)